MSAPMRIVRYLSTCYSRFTHKGDHDMIKQVSVDMDVINGLAIGIEFVPAMQDPDIGEIPNTVILDILVIGLLFQWL
jgi:hypothetical protein